MRGNVYQLAEMIVKDSTLMKECMEKAEDAIGDEINQTSMSIDMLEESKTSSPEDKIKAMCKAII